jgi:hypothetical protein
MLQRPVKYFLGIDWSGLDAKFEFNWLADRQVTRAIVLSAGLLLSNIGNWDKRLLDKSGCGMVLSDNWR